MRIKIKHFKPGDKIFLFNSRVHLFGYSKLRSKWEDLYLVLHATNHGAVTLQSDDRSDFKMNGQCLKIFLKPEPLEFKEVDILHFQESSKFTSTVCDEPHPGHLSLLFSLSSKLSFLGQWN